MSQERLKPARYEGGGEKPEFGPRFPWGWVILGITTVSILGGGYYWRQQSKAAALKNDIELAYDRQVHPIAAKVREFRDGLDAHIAKAAEADPPEDWADPRLQLSGLHDAQGLYLRLPADAAAGSPEEIAAAAAEMHPDAIPRCLGLAPMSARALYDQGEFLMPEWLGEVRTMDSLMKLRVRDEELATHIERDLPMFANMTRSDYFLLLLVRGENRREAPVDVWMWDLTRDELLLKTRAEAKGLLLPVRIGVGDAPRRAAKPEIDSAGAIDCSIAAQVKELAGEPAMGVGADSAAALQAARAEQADGGTAAPDGGATAPAPDAGAP